MESDNHNHCLNLSIKQIEALYDKGKDVTVGFIRFTLDQIMILTETVKKQQGEIQELNARINKDSHNSSKPPSSDPPYKKPKTRSLRKKSGKKPGGQKGHKGSSLKQTPTPDKTEKVRPEGNCICGEDLSNALTIDYIIRQLFDIPCPQLFSIEYQGEVTECKCGKIHYPIFPEGVQKEAQYGSNVKALAVYLKTYGFISYDRIVEFFSDVCNFEISQGSIVNFVNEAAKKSEPAVEQIKSKLTEVDVLHCDESGIRIGGSLNWLHTTGTIDLTYYYPHKKRGKEAMDEIDILPNFYGTVVHDHWSSYYQYSNFLHSLCNAHHLRELTTFEELGETWAKRVIETLLEAKSEIEREGSLPSDRIKYYKMRMRRNITAGFKFRQFQVDIEPTFSIN